MKSRRILSGILASVMVCAAFAGCNKKTDVSETKEIPQNAHEAVDTSNFEDKIAAESGDAYLAIVDGGWDIQYWGKNDDGSLLAYDAGVAKINGNGDYTVSVSANTQGFQYGKTGDPNGTFAPTGVSFMSVIIKDGEKLYPNAIITVNEIKVNGKNVKTSSKAYTSTDDAVDTRANILNTYLNGVPAKNARTAEGVLYDGSGNPLDICKNYSPEIISADDFAEWSTVQVNFTVSGIS